MVKAKGLKQLESPKSVGYTILATTGHDWYLRSVLSQPGTAPERGQPSQKLHGAASSSVLVMSQSDRLMSEPTTVSLKPAEQQGLRSLPGSSGQGLIMLRALFGPETSTCGYGVGTVVRPAPVTTVLPAFSQASYDIFPPTTFLSQPIPSESQAFLVLLPLAEVRARLISFTEGCSEFIIVLRTARHTVQQLLNWSAWKRI